MPISAAVSKASVGPVPDWLMVISAVWSPVPVVVLIVSLAVRAALVLASMFSVMFLVPVPSAGATLTQGLPASTSAFHVAFDLISMVFV